MTLVSPDWLAERLDDPSVVVLSVSFLPGHGAAWFEGHIPGSHNVYWKDLCWDDTERRFPSPATMAARLERWGVSDGSTLVLVGDPLQFATYAYWVMAMTGLERVTTVLDGGHAAWVRRGFPTTEDTTHPPTPGRVTPGDADDTLRVGRDDVLAMLGDPAVTLVDLRTREEYVGERVAPVWAAFDHGAERAGHIPGAHHLPYERLLTEEGTFRPPSEIESCFAEIGSPESTEVVTYCRLSHRASLGWYALTRITDRRNVRVYDGSWTEWGSMVGMPIER